MERGNLEAYSLWNQVFDPLFHLLGGLVGEGESHDLVGIVPLLLDEVSDLVGDNPGLTGARTSQHHDRAIQVFDSLLLCRIEFFSGFGHALSYGSSPIGVGL